VTVVDNLLGGSIVGNPDKNGETLNDELHNSNVPDWPDKYVDFDIPNAKLRIYGGAQVIQCQTYHFKII
jgi:hypothetical protein